MPASTLQTRFLHFVTLASGLALLAFSGWVHADPPSRVARLGYTSGAVSFSPAGEIDWVQATLNRPLTNGDRLWADARGRAEIQVGGAMIRMDANTSLAVLNLDDQIAQLQLTQGSLNVRVRSLEPNQVFEVDTPNLAFTLRQPGEYRITVDPSGDATDILVRKGRGEAAGDGAIYAIDARQPYRFTGTGLQDYQTFTAPRADEFDRWATNRDRQYDNSVSAQYVSRDVVGYQDLDENGTWSVDATYGNVWYPRRVAANWAPYRDGHWAWVDPWGWTWVDDAPWGFAVSHYGRWAYMGNNWGWVPGPPRTRAWYAPALVAFVGGDNFQLSISSTMVGGVAWFSLAPREVYRPPYASSRNYFDNVNRSNTVVNNTILNTYNTTNVTNIVYANRRVPGAVIAVPRTTFLQSQPVSRAAVPAPRDVVTNGLIAAWAQVAPTERSVRGRTDKGTAPPPRVFERPVVARTAPPAARVGFAAQQPQLAATPGKPLDDPARKSLRPAAAATPAPAPVVKLIAPPAAAAVSPSTGLAPLAVPVTPPAGSRPNSDQRGNRDQRNAPAAAAPATQAPAPPPAAPPALSPAKSPAAPAAQPPAKPPVQPQAQSGLPTLAVPTTPAPKPVPTPGAAPPPPPPPAAQAAKPDDPVLARPVETRPPAAAKPAPAPAAAPPPAPATPPAQATPQTQAAPKVQHAPPAQAAPQPAPQPAPQVRAAPQVQAPPAQPVQPEAAQRPPRGQRAAPSDNNPPDAKNDDEDAKRAEERGRQKR